MTRDAAVDIGEDNIEGRARGGMSMAKTPRDYPETMASPESGRPMARGEKLVALKVDGQAFEYRQPGWWRSLDDPDDLDGQLVDDDNLAAERTRRAARAIAKGEAKWPSGIRSSGISAGHLPRPR